MFGEKLKELREANGLLQRQVAAELEVDTAYISKMESDGKPVSRNHLKKLAILFKVSEEVLLTFWLADKVYGVVKDEEVAIKAVQLAEEVLKITKRKKNK